MSKHKKPPFFILGLPRSRTAWLANFMTTGNVFCHHEGTNGCKTLAEYRVKLGSDGDSNTGLMLFDLNRFFPKSKILIIESEELKAAQFIQKNFEANGAAVARMLQARLNLIEGKRIPIDQLDNRLQEIWEYLTDEPFNSKRAEFLIRLRVERKDIYDLDFNAAREFRNDAESQTALH